MLGNEESRYQANADKSNENDSDDGWQHAYRPNCQRCLKRMNRCVDYLCTSLRTSSEVVKEF